MRNRVGGFLFTKTEQNTDFCLLEILQEMRDNIPGGEVMYKYYNPNPAGRTVGDCAVRALSKALNISWEEAYEKMAENGYKMADMPSSDSVWGSVLRMNGFYRQGLPNLCPDCYTAEDFCWDNPVGVYVLGFGNHTATVVDGNLYDSWDSSKEIPIYYWSR